jgi:hypothetical protein
MEAAPIEELPCPSCKAPVKISGALASMSRVTDTDGEATDSLATAHASQRTKCNACGAQLERVVSPVAAWRLSSDQPRR